MKFSFERLTFPIKIDISTSLCGLHFPTQRKEDLKALQDLFAESYEYGLKDEIQGHCLCMGEDEKSKLPVGILNEDDKYYLTRDEDTAYLHHPACALHEWKIRFGARA